MLCRAGETVNFQNMWGDNYKKKKEETLTLGLKIQYLELNRSRGLFFALI